jgi:hypothetical protein
MRRICTMSSSLLLSLPLLVAGHSSTAPAPNLVQTEFGHVSNLELQPDRTICPLCAPSLASLPESWRPHGKVQEGLSHAAWSERESEDAMNAVKAGLDEMINFYSQRPESVTALQDDSVESLIEVAYAGVNTPALTETARDAARRNLATLIAPYLQRTPESARCDEFQQLLPLAIYAGAGDSHLGIDRDDPRIGTMVALTNSAYRACGSLEAAIGHDYKPMLENLEKVVADQVSELGLQGQSLIGAQATPGLELPAEALDFPRAFWRSLEDYPLYGADEFPDGARNQTFYYTAYLATHVAYFVTGDGRYPIHVEDSPSLYRFLRENFYAVLEMGELDLVAEFVDNFRQYGYTEENDLQVRDGTRYLLNLYHAAGDRWMNHREPGETDQNLTDYDLIHKAWTAVQGLRPRVPEPAEQGTYGGILRAWLPAPR